MRLRPLCPDYSKTYSIPLTPSDACTLESSVNSVHDHRRLARSATQLPDPYHPLFPGVLLGPRLRILDELLLVLLILSSDIAFNRIVRLWFP